MTEVMNATTGSVTFVEDYGLPKEDGMYLVHYGLSILEALPIVVMHINETEEKRERFYILDKYGMYCEETSDWLEPKYIYAWIKCEKLEVK